jgi:putative tryptophan/tyrosine transport system substrate-binding protein
MSYGPDLIYLYRRIGPIVGRILHGARPADFPIERPTKFELVINLKAAKVLGVAVPGSLLATANDLDRLRKRRLVFPAFCPRANFSI